MYPDFALVQPSASERQLIVTATYPRWGAALSLDGYLAREAYIASDAVPLAAHGGFTPWMLTTASSSSSNLAHSPPPPPPPPPPTTATTTTTTTATQATDDHQQQQPTRPILASCETLRKHAVWCPVVGPGDDDPPASSPAVPVEAIAYGVASVFTDPHVRRRGHASRMMRALGERLGGWHTTTTTTTTTTAEGGGRANNGGSSGDGDGDGDQDDHHDGEAKDKATDIASQSKTPPHGRQPAPPTICSVLYSDVGKTFYARCGWAAFPSREVSFPAAATPAGESSVFGGALRPIAADGDGEEEELEELKELEELCRIDEAQLRKALVRRAASLATAATDSSHHGDDNKNGEGKKTTKAVVVVLPDIDQMRWHFRRENFTMRRIFGRTPSVRGAIYDAGGEGKRIWALWERSYYGVDDQAGQEGEGGPKGKQEAGEAKGDDEDVASRKRNALYIMRLVIEGHLDDDGDEEKKELDVEEEDLVDGFRAVIQAAQAQAAEWKCGVVQMWNPTSRVSRLIAKSGIEHEYAERENDNICSMRWYGPGEAGEVEWMANERYAWL